MKMKAPVFDLQKVKKVKMKRLITLGVIASVVLVALLFWSREIIREAVVLPLSYLFWVGGILIDSTPQMFFWLATLFITFIMAVNSFSDRRKTVPLSMVHPGLSEIPQSTGRMTYWSVRVQMLRSGRGAYFERTYQSALVRLLVETLAYRYRLTTRQVENELRDGTLDIPAEVREYALGGMDHYPTLQGGFFKQLLDRIVDGVRGWIVRLRPAQAAPVDPQIALILNYLRDELEVSNDDSGR